MKKLYLLCILAALPFTGCTIPEGAGEGLTEFFTLEEISGPTRDGLRAAIVGYLGEHINGAQADILLEFVLDDLEFSTLTFGQLVNIAIRYWMAAQSAGNKSAGPIDPDMLILKAALDGAA